MPASILALLHNVKVQCGSFNIVVYTDCEYLVSVHILELMQIYINNVLPVLFLVKMLNFLHFQSGYYRLSAYRADFLYTFNLDMYF